MWGPSGAVPGLARGVQDLPNGGWCHGDAEVHQPALDPAMAP
jgi:hypothetical protein